MPEIDEQQIDAGSIDAAEGQATSEFSIPQEYS